MSNFQIMTPYVEVIRAAGDTAEKILALAGKPLRVIVTTAGGQSASVSWTKRAVTLNLPSIAAATMLTRRHANQIVGFIAHEMLHVLFTDDTVWQQAVREGEIVMHLTNAVEDVRIERKGIKSGLLPGLLDALSETCVLMHGKNCANALEAGAKFGTAREHSAALIATLGRLANGYRIPQASNLMADVAPELLPMVRHALDQMPRLRSTSGSLGLAQVLARMLQAIPRQPQPQPEGQPGQPGQPDDSQISEGQGQGEAGQTASDPQDGSEGEGQPQDGASQPTDDATDVSEGEAGQDSGSEGEASGDASTGQETPSDDSDDSDPSKGDGDGSEGESGSDPDPESDPDPDSESAGNGAGQGRPDVQDATDDGIGPMLDSSPSLDDVAKENRADPLTHYGDQSKRSKLSAYRGADTQHGGSNPIGARSVIDRIVRPALLADSVSRLVISEARVAQRRYLHSGRFDRRAAARASYGSGNVFMKRTYAQGVETAVVLLLDGSSSMKSGGKIYNARSLAYHLGVAVDAAGGKCAIAAFYDDFSEVKLCSLRVLKDWTETVDASRIAAADAIGGTPLSPAILAAAEMLIDVDCERRIVLALTDGECNMGEACVRDAVKIAESWGVECAGIGIGGYTSVRDVFPIGVDLGDGANLSVSGLSLLVDMLEREQD